MVADLESYLEQILSIRRDAAGLGALLNDDAFNWQPAPGRWSVGQCFEHLNVTANTYVPLLDGAIDRARVEGRLAPGPFSYSFLEIWFARRMEPPVARRWMRAPAAFQPGPALSRDVVMSRFGEVHDRLADSVRRADGVDLRRARVKSPFGPLRFSLGQTFQLLLAHERRHIWQAREVMKEMKLEERVEGRR